MRTTMRNFHRRSIAALVLVIVWAGAAASAPPLELENRLAECSDAIKDVMEAPDGGIPADLLRRSRAIIIFPSVLKAGLGIGGHYGNGVILRRDPSTGKWGPPAFISLVGGSVGWQVGIQSTQLVLLVMSPVSLKSLFRGKVTIGADASVAAGPVGRDASAGTDIALSAGMLSYSRAKGLFAGVSLKGSIIEPDWEANEAYYGSDVSIIDIFFRGRGRPSRAARNLMRLLNRYSR
jgi:lipid-binding SYLF domain-containing protein